MNHNVDATEVAKFNRLAGEWWNPEGNFKTLHRINPVRLRYLQQQTGPLNGKNVLDVGCGGGILAESMAALGASVTAVDLAQDSINAAKAHAASQNIRVDYRLLAVDDLLPDAAEHFDLITCMELLEHVPEPAELIHSCAALCKPGGDLVFSTINRSPRAFALAIIGAEYLLRLVPMGTHEYERFIRPSELAAWSRAAGLDVSDISGMRYNPLNHTASLATDVAVNYLMHCRKQDRG